MEIKNDTSYVKNIKCQDVYTESQTDFSLPDYLGDVRKILFTEATLRPSGRFAGGDEVELSGVVVYNIVYSDSEGELSSVEFTSDYDYSVKCSAENYKDSVCDTRISAYSVRLIGPRRVSARASLVGSVRLSENATLSVSGSAFAGENSPEVSTKNVVLRSTTPSAITEREYAEQIARLDGVIADEVSVIHSAAEVALESVSAEGDLVNLKGKIRMVCCVKLEESPAYSVEKTLPFEESLDLEGAGDGKKLIPELMVTSVKTNVNADDAGCELVMNTIVEFCVLGEGNRELELITDGYLKTCATENSYENFNYQTLSDVRYLKENHTAEMDRAELECENIHDIILMDSVVKLESAECNDGVVTLRGEVRYSGVASEISDGESSYVPIKFTAPFEINENIGCENNENMQVEAKLSTRSATASLDANKIYLGSIIEGVLTIIEDKSEKILSNSDAKENESFRPAGCGITVYYPTSSDTLFSVAKRFHTSSLKVARDNDIAEQVFAADNPDGRLTGIKKLLIY